MTLLRSLFILSLVASFAFAGVASASIQANTGAIAADEKPADGKKADEEPECD